MNKQLYNKKGKNDLIKDLDNENFDRITISFYKYTNINDPYSLRDDIYKKLYSLNVLGRIYVAFEGINAQISIPDYNKNEIIKYINSIEGLNGVIIKKAIVDGESFYKLKIKIKKEIVAYNINNNEYDMNLVGKHLEPEDFNKYIDSKDSIVVDVRNYYEAEVGKFKNAIIPNIERSQELLPEIKRLLKENKNKKILLYCTGGIRCEKASSYLIKCNFKDVNQLKGGIINYANVIKKKKMKSKFIGKNFVFDNRLGENITDDIISKCHICESKNNTHRNCMNDLCHILFIQCNKCFDLLSGCCSNKCKDYYLLDDKQKSINKKEFIKYNTRRLGRNIKPDLKNINNS